MCPFLIRDLDNCRADKIFFCLPHSLCQALTEVSSTELVGAASSATLGNVVLRSRGGTLALFLGLKQFCQKVRATLVLRCWRLLFHAAPHSLVVG